MSVVKVLGRNYDKNFNSTIIKTLLNKNSVTTIIILIYTKRRAKATILQFNKVGNLLN